MANIEKILMQKLYILAIVRKEGSGQHNNYIIIGLIALIIILILVTVFTNKKK